MPSSRSSTRVKMKTVSTSAKEIFSSRWKMISPYFSQSSCDRSVVNPSSTRRPMRRWTGSRSAAHSGGSSAFSCIFVSVLVDQANQVGEFKRFAEEVVGAALAGLLRDVAVAGEDDVGDRPGAGIGLERVAQLPAPHPLDGEVGEDH